jgi:hypothetical protein
MPRRVRECPNCGHVRKAPVSTIEPAEGQLVELRRHGGTLPTSSTEIRIMGRKMPLIMFFAELRYIGQERGYKFGWALNQYRQAVGAWPADRHVEPVVASYEVGSWVKAGLRRYASRQGRARV